jgi:2-oxoglutarate ferredoxin oxidoreductase subunit gamma
VRKDKELSLAPLRLCVKHNSHQGAKAPGNHKKASMAKRHEIRLAGSGGQGLILAGIILAEAAGIYDGKFVCQTQSYGPEARGGTSKAEVVISDTEIDYPQAIHPDVLVALNQKSLDAYIFDLEPEGLILVDADLVTEAPSSRTLALPFTRIARDLGTVMVINLVALGALAQFTGVVSLQGLEAAMLARVPKGTEDLNRRALAAGIAAPGSLDRRAPWRNPGKSLRP